MAKPKVYIYCDICKIMLPSTHFWTWFIERGESIMRDSICILCRLRYGFTKEFIYETFIHQVERGYKQLQKIEIVGR